MLLPTVWFSGPNFRIILWLLDNYPSTSNSSDTKSLISWLDSKESITLVVLLEPMLFNHCESRGPNRNTPLWNRQRCCFTKKTKSAKVSQQLSATQPAINTWLQHFINDKINSFFSYFAILIYSDTTQGKRAEMPYEDDARIWSTTHSHARQTSSFHFQEYFNSSHFGQKSIAEMQHIFIQEIKHITLP